MTQYPRTPPVGNYTIPVLEPQGQQAWPTEAIVALVGLFIAVVPIAAFVWKKSEPCRVAFVDLFQKRTLTQSSPQSIAELGEFQPVERTSTLNRAMTL